ncbi:hypothetical protein IJG78_02665 [Candidatus Saccharibacteria bacterium]|nr:hypothetical protein [Candidatus Saccharibacteria bacterium]
MQNLTTNQAIAAGGIVGGMMTLFIIFGIAIAVFGIIAGWKIFQKAGQPGWKVLIPIYNLYIAFKIVGMNFWGWFVALFGTYLLMCLTGNMGMVTDANGQVVELSMNAWGWIFFCAYAILSIAVDIIYSIRLAKAFKKGAGFVVGLILLPYIFSLVLGFGSAKYDKKILKD